MRSEEREYEVGAGDGPWEPWLSDLARGCDEGDVGRVQAILDDLWRFPFHAERACHPDRWELLFDLLLRLLAHDDASIRDLADHYAWIAIAQEGGQGSAERRIAQLLRALQNRIESGEVELLRFVDELVHVEGLTDLKPQELCRAWIEARAATPAQAQAARIAYLDGRTSPEDPHAIDLTELIELLDAPDDMVRAFAARALGRRYSESEYEGPPTLRDFVATLTTQELERPGIAGPFFSNWYDFGLDDFAERSGVDVPEWLCTILASRRHPEPNTLPCSNGIDFFAHEVFGSSAVYVRRLIDMGHTELAVQAATEGDEAVDELLPLLIELGSDPDAGICRRASWHLATQHRHLHPAGEARGFIRFIQPRALNDGVELWVQLTASPDGGRSAYAAVLYPIGRESFDDPGAATALEFVLPEATRGELLPFGLPGDGGTPSLWFHGRTANARYAHGALVQYTGDVDAHRWERIHVIWRGTPGAWRPETVT